MAGVFSLLGTMGSALQAQQAALNVTGQNVANVNTPGYVQRGVVLQDQVADGGVTVQSVQRSFDQFTYAQVLTQQGLKSAADSRGQAVTEAQSVVAPAQGNSVSDSMTSFFASLQALSANPGDAAARGAVLTQADQVAQSFSSTASGLQQIQSGLLTQASGSVGQLNSDLAKVAQLNSQIEQANATGDNAPDLRDQRDTLVNDVSTLVGGQVVQDPSGSVTLYAAGATLVNGDHAATVDLSQDASGAMKFTRAQPGGAATDITSGVTAGSLGGMREARDVDIASTASQLDALAYNFAGAVNSVHQAGYGLDGVTGRPLFTPPSTVAGAAAAMSVDPQVEGNPSAIAAGASAQDVPGGNGALLQLEQVADQPLAGGGTPAAQFGAIAAQIGSAAATATSDSTTRGDTLTQAQNMNSSVSGVSLNEEMVKLTQFQQAFEASTQVLQMADSLLSSFLSTVGTVSG